MLLAVQQSHGVHLHHPACLQSSSRSCDAHEARQLQRPSSCSPALYVLLRLLMSAQHCATAAALTALNAAAACSMARTMPKCFKQMAHRLPALQDMRVPERTISQLLRRLSGRTEDLPRYGDPPVQPVMSRIVCVISEAGDVTHANVYVSPSCASVFNMAARARSLLPCVPMHSGRHKPSSASPSSARAELVQETLCLGVSSSSASEYNLHAGARRSRAGS